MSVGSYRNLIVWKKSLDLVELIYKSTKNFSREELYGLVSQMRRAAVSIPSNIAEGSKRGTRADFRRFIFIAFGSGAELETQVEIAKRLLWVANEDAERIEKVLDEIMRMLKVLASKLQ